MGSQRTKRDLATLYHQGWERTDKEDTRSKRCFSSVSPAHNHSLLCSISGSEVANDFSYLWEDRRFCKRLKEARDNILRIVFEWVDLKFKKQILGNKLTHHSRESSPWNQNTCYPLCCGAIFLSSLFWCGVSYKMCLSSLRCDVSRRHLACGTQRFKRIT